MPLASHRLLLDGRVIDLDVTDCRTVGSRLLGAWRWGGRIPPGCALRLAPCAAVHTFGLGRSLDVAFCDVSGRVLRLVHALQPHRVAWCRGASVALEFRAGTGLRLGLREGCRLTLSAEGRSRVPRMEKAAP